MKNMWKRTKNRIKCLDNNGSALLTVVLVVAFLTILATILLYITGMNFQIKQADYQNKKNFYTGEEALEEIRANLMKDISDAAVEANASMAAHYAEMTSKDTREYKYNTYFMTEMDEILKKKIEDKGSVDAFLKSYFTNTTNNDFELKMDYDKYDSDGNTSLSYAEGVEVNTTEAYFVIRGVKMRYTNPDTKVTTIISTDFKIVAPDIDWSADSSVFTLGSDTVAIAAAQEKVTPCDSIVYTNWKKE